MLPATAVQPPDPSQAPALPPVPAPPQPQATVVVMNPDGSFQNLPVPLTRRAVEEIKDRREELSSQLISANSRRKRLADELTKQPAGPARTGIEGRLVVLDARLVQLEADIAATGRQLTAAQPALVASTEIPMNPDMPDNVLALSIVFTLFVLFPVAFALARNLWKRGSRGPAPASSPETNQRLERLEQGVDAIAIEIERVSEGQRFVTKLLSEAAVTPRIGAAEKTAERV
ncbi:MAG: hypothetical protein ACSLFK_03040 [Gemmatimonadaceae bacterium]